MLFDLIDFPETVNQVMKQVRKLYIPVYEAFEQYGDKKNFGSSSGMKLYSPGRTNPVQADFICILKPDLFRKFVLPALEEEAEFLDHSCFHLDGPGALPFLDDILSIEDIDAVQWVPGAGARPQHQWPEVIHKIQSAGKAALLYGDCRLIKQSHKEYKPELVVYDVQAESLSQGLELLDWLQDNT